MGVFGTGLYSGDFAMDLRATVAAVTRLPFSTTQILKILRDAEPSAANNPTDEGHTTFWLIIADQFAKRGIVDDEVRSRALDIVDTGEDIQLLKKLGMKESDLRKRQKVLEELRARIAESSQGTKRRATLKKPQPLLMEIGDVLVYPT